MSFDCKVMLKGFRQLLLVAAVSAFGVGQASAAGLLSPKGDSSSSLQIKDHIVKVIIEDGYAITRIEQVFNNPHGKDFEAIYSFPVPEKAAVSEFTYWIDGQPVSGEVLAKEKARKVYKQEKTAGREAAITEQDDYRTFDISVWPVQAGKDVRVRLSYIQPVHLDTGVGRFVYPLEEGGVDEEKASFWSMNDQVVGRFSFDLELRATYPIDAIRLPSHPSAKINRDAEGDWHVHLGHDGSSTSLTEEEISDEVTPNVIPTTQPSESQPSTVRLDSDVVVYWKLQEGLPAGIDMTIYKEATDKRGTFMMALTPGDDFAPIASGRDWVFVLDISGSMAGKFATLAEGVALGLKKLTPNDRFRIIYFNSGTEGSSYFKNATPENIDAAVGDLAQVKVNGGTNLYAGLAHGLSKLDSDRSTGLVLVTDGVANVGETHRRKFIELVEKQDVRLFTLVMGNSANRPMLEAISLASGGTALNISNSDDVVGAVLSATSKITHAALHDIQVNIDGVRNADLTPTRIGSLYRGEQLIVFGHYWGSGKANVDISAKLSGKDVHYKANFNLPDVSLRNPEIERLWAFSKIEGLMHDQDLFGQSDDVEQAVTDIAIENGLVTPYTSMVVVREKMFDHYGIDRKNLERLLKEKTAQQARIAQTDNSVQDANQTQTFNSSQSTYKSTSSGSSGGGSAIDPIMVALMLLGIIPLGVSLYRRRYIK